MARKYTYKNSKTGEVLFETVEQNYISAEDVDRKMVEHTKKDPRLDPFIERQVRVVYDIVDSPSKGRHDKNKKIKGFV